MSGYRFFYIIVFLFLFVSGKSQQENYFSLSDTSNFISLYTDASYNSNNLGNKFVNAFRNSEFLTDDLKSEASQKLNSNNRFGGDLFVDILAKINYDTLFKRPNLSLIFGLQDREHIDLKFSKNAFDLMFFGNKPFAGDTLDLGELSMNVYRYQKLKLGLLNENKEEGMVTGIAINFIKGEMNQMLYSPSTTVYTEEFGREVSVSSLSFYNGSDTTNNGFWALNGAGVSFDLFGEFELKKRGKISFYVTDIGFINWNRNSTTISIDSTTVYEGVEIDNLFDIQSGFSFTTDSILNEVGASKRNRIYMSPTPIVFNSFFSDTINSKMKYAVGVYHQLFVNHIPKVYAQFFWSPIKEFSVVPQISYGGYGKFNSGLGLMLNTKSLNLVVGTRNLESLFSESTFGMSVFGGLGYRF